MNPITTYDKAVSFINDHVPKSKNKLFSADFGLERMKKFMELLGNPQNELKVIHIAGTSGKGSTAYYTSALLEIHGFSVGLHISPHLEDVRERIQINRTNISKKLFLDTLNKLLPAITTLSKSEFGTPSYFEILVAMAYRVFKEERVDYAVMETGFGGTFDGTNVVDRSDKLVIITRIGFDHMEILGNTLPHIASQKSGIIHEKNTVITLHQKPEVMKIFTDRVQKQHGLLLIPSYSHIHVDHHNQTIKTSFSYAFQTSTIDRIMLSTPALFQVENCSLALAAIQYISKRDGFRFNKKTSKNQLLRMKVPGRMETKIINSKIFIIDGAHNPQKMESFTLSIKKAYPNKKWTILLAVKKGKDYGPMIDCLIPLTNTFILTTFSQNSDTLQTSEDPTVLEKEIHDKGFIKTTIIQNPNVALKTIIQSKVDCLITGSFYLLASILPDLHRS
jgi:dihydrofolate synthase / folylpolyglutamate synthase